MDELDTYQGLFPYRVGRVVLLFFYTFGIGKMFTWIHVENGLQQNI